MVTVFDGYALLTPASMAFPLQGVDISKIFEKLNAVYRYFPSHMQEKALFLYSTFYRLLCYIDQTINKVPQTQERMAKIAYCTYSGILIYAGPTLKFYRNVCPRKKTYLL